MSDYETHRGRITKLDIPVPENASELKALLEDRFQPACFLKNYDSAEEYINSEHATEYYAKGKYLFKIENEELSEDEDTITIISDKELTYHTRFYNGGTWIGEVIEEIIQKHL